MKTLLLDKKKFDETFVCISGPGFLVVIEGVTINNVFFELWLFIYLNFGKQKNYEIVNFLVPLCSLV